MSLCKAVLGAEIFSTATRKVAELEFAATAFQSTSLGNRICREIRDMHLLGFPTVGSFRIHFYFSTERRCPSGMNPQDQLGGTVLKVSIPVSAQSLASVAQIF